MQFIEKEADNLDISSSLRAKVEQHTEATRSLLDHYSVKVSLANPLSEYARYVLTKGIEKDRHELAKGIQQRLLFKNGKLKIKG